MLAIVTPDMMREVDAGAAESVEVLIERAGRRLARRARSMLGGVYGRRVVIVAGPGNNGADGRVCGQVLAAAGVKVIVVAPTADELPACDLIIDAAYGTGMNRGWKPPRCDPGTAVLAADVPSGVDGLTGEILGDAWTAQVTVTFGALKPGLLLHPGADLTGHIDVAGLGLDVSGASAWLFTQADAAQTLPRPDPAGHKWKRAVRVVGGSAGMTGAPVLAASAALRTGAGYAHCVLAGGRPPLAMSEIVFSDEPDRWADLAITELGRFGSLAIGPGLGRTDDARRGLHRVLRRSVGELPTVIDADALHLLGGTRLDPSVVLTPHDGEFAALTGHAPGADRFAAVRSLAAARNATVLLKGPLTIVATPDGQCRAIGNGDARLATAGSGDVLTGTIASLLAAGLAPLNAATLGAWIHADAARRCPPVGMVASDLLATLAHSVSAHTQVTGGTDAGN